MTNLELLIKCDPEVKQIVIEEIIMQCCIDPENMKVKRTSSCHGCMFSVKSGQFTKCDKNKIIEWLNAERTEYVLHG